MSDHRVIQNASQKIDGGSDKHASHPGLGEQLLREANDGLAGGKSAFGVAAAAAAERATPSETKVSHLDTAADMDKLYASVFKSQQLQQPQQQLEAA